VIKTKKASKDNDRGSDPPPASKTPIERIFEMCVGRKMTAVEKRILEVNSNGK